MRTSNSKKRTPIFSAAFACAAMWLTVTAIGYAQAPAAIASTTPSETSANAESPPGSAPAAAAPAAAVPASSEEELRKRVAQLEAEMEMMREEIKRLKEPASSVTNAGLAPAAASQPAATPVAAALPAQPASQEKGEHRPGFEVGPVRVIPYGAIYFNLFGNSGGTNNSDVPLFATPTGAANTSATARQTRFGLHLEGPQIGGAKSSGAVEADFFGGFPAIGIGEDFGLVRVRTAFVRLDWKDTSLEAGQDWTIFSPLNPVSLASLAIPDFAAAGNLWARIPQVRLEHRWLEGKLTWAGAALASTTGDFPPAGTPSPALLQPGTGALSRIPAFESRLGLSSGKDWLGSKKTASIGISMHYGWARAVTGIHHINVDVMGVSGDWFLPFGDRVTLAGEAFFGRNLAAFQGDVFQTFIPDFAYRVRGVLVPGGPRAGGTRGGWSQLGFTPPGLSDRITFYGGFGLEDPRDQDFVSLSKRDSRLRNLSYEVSVMYKFSPQLQWGLEYRRDQTLYLISGQQNNNHLNLAAAYSF